jgi:hypothetical protein
MHRNLLAIGAIIVIGTMVLIVPATTIGVDAKCVGKGSAQACASASGGSASASASTTSSIAKAFANLWGAFAFAGTR